MGKMEMLEYDRIDVSVGIDTRKLGGSRECVISQYWCFLKVNFRFQPKVHYSCHDMMQKSMSFNNVSIVPNGDTIVGFIFG